MVMLKHGIPTIIWSCVSTAVSRLRWRARTLNSLPKQWRHTCSHSRTSEKIAGGLRRWSRRYSLAVMSRVSHPLFFTRSLWSGCELLLRSEHKGGGSMLTDPLLRGAIDERMIAAMRLMLALLALLSTYIDPAETTHYLAATYTVLALYLAYSIALLTLAVRRRSTIPATVAYWADVGWDILLIGSSMGTNSIFFFFLFFAILVASFQSGFTAGMRVTLVATVLFTAVGFAMAPAEPEFELNGFLLRPTSLLVLGYMIACWGGAETTLRRRLALLKDVSVLANPRFGVERTFGALLERLRAFYAAEQCLLVMTDPSGGTTVRRVQRQRPPPAASAAAMPEEVARLLLALPRRRRRSWAAAPGAGAGRGRARGC